MDIQDSTALDPGAETARGGNRVVTKLTGTERTQAEGSPSNPRDHVSVHAEDLDKSAGSYEQP